MTTRTKICTPFFSQLTKTCSSCLQVGEPSFVVFIFLIFYLLCQMIDLLDWPSTELTFSFFV